MSESDVIDGVSVVCARMPVGTEDSESNDKISEGKSVVSPKALVSSGSGLTVELPTTV